MNSNNIKLADQTIGKMYFSLFKDKKEIPFNKIKKIVVIKLWGIGNLIMVLPSIKKLKDKYPEANIELITLEQNKGLLEHIKYINKINYISIKSQALSLKQIMSITRVLKNKKIDLLIDFEQFLNISSIITNLIRPKTSIGFLTKKRIGRKVFNYKIKYDNRIHMVNNFSNLLKPLPINTKITKLEKIKYSEKDKLKADKLLPKGDYKLIGIHVGTADRVDVRRWPEENFIDLTKKLLRDNNKLIVLTGGKKEIDICERIESEVNNKKLINICNKTNILELSRLLERCEVFISNDTGPMHLAAAMGTKTIGLFGPNTPVLYGPYGKNNISIFKNIHCSPCITNLNYKLTDCKDNQCMKEISIKEVLREI